MKFNHPPKFGIFFVAPAAPQFGICFAAPAAPPPSEAAPSSGTPPPEEESPNPVMNFVKTINKDYGGNYLFQIHIIHVPVQSTNSFVSFHDRDN